MYSKCNPCLGLPVQRALPKKKKKKKTWSEGHYFLLLISAQALKGVFTTGAGRLPSQFKVKWAWLTRWLQKGGRRSQVWQSWVRGEYRRCQPNLAVSVGQERIVIKGRRLVCQMLLPVVSSADPIKEVSIQPCLELWSIFDQTESLRDKGITKQKTRDYKFWIYDRSATGLTSPRGVHKTQRKAESKQ